MVKTINKEVPNADADDDELLSTQPYHDATPASSSGSGASALSDDATSASSSGSGASAMNKGSESIPSPYKSNVGSDSSDSDWNTSINPMVCDYQQSIGLHDPDDPGHVLVGKKLYSEARIKDVPCQFHDGVSGRCFKGASCVYGHELGTGGLYEKEHPEEAFAKAIRRSVTFVGNLPNKSVFEKEAEIFCEITHVEDPYRFFIRPSKNLDGSCSCTKIQALVPKINRGEGESFSLEFFEKYAESGFTYEDEPGEAVAKLKNPRIDEKINAFLETALTYKKYQEQEYVPLAELVAVRVNQRWCRAIVLPSCDLTSIIADSIGTYTPDTRAQLLETGEKVRVGPNDICRLPEQFSTVPTGVFKCSIFGISPVWGTWSSGCTKLFKDLIKDKKTKIIVKIIPPCNREETTSLFERWPYSVKVMFALGAKWIDLAEEMNQAGHGLPWNLFPKRPFITKVIDTKGFDLLYTQGHKLPESQLELENRRLGLSRTDPVADDDSEDSSAHN